VTVAPLHDHAFLHVRPDPLYRLDPTRRLCVRRVELLDEDGAVLVAWDFGPSIGPVVRGP